MNQNKFIAAKVKERLELLKLRASALFDLAKVMFSVGVTIIFIYCFSESVSPSGAKLTDAFPFFYIAFSFSVILTLGALFGTCSVIGVYRTLIWIARRLKPKLNVIYHPTIDGKFMLAVSWFLLAIFTLLPLQEKISPEINYWGTLLFFLLVGFFVILLFLAKSNLEKPTTKAVKLGVLFMVTLLALIIYRPTLMNLTMGNAGMRSLPSDYVIIDTKNYDFAFALSQSLNLPFKACKIGATGKWVTRDMQVIWHGIGEKTFVRFVGTSEKKRQPGGNSLYPLSRDGVDLLRSAGDSLLCK